MGENLESSLPEKQRSGTKRAFHNRSGTSQAHHRQGFIPKKESGLISSCNTNSGVSSTSPGDGDVGRYPEEVFDNDPHTEKRSRTSDWPLRSTTSACNEAPSIPRVALRDRHDTLNSASPHCRTTVKPRPSKFVEGSMNDRASQKPHLWYISDSEQSQEQFEAEQYFHGDAQTRPQLSVASHYVDRSVALSVVHDKSDVLRPSSIFRFGKSVAAALNPSSWKIWSKQQEEDAQDKRILRERQEKAETIYKELKRTGQLRDSAYENHLGNQEESMPLNKHNSGVGLEHRSPETDSAHRIGSRTVENTIGEKRYGRIFLDPPSTCSFRRGESPASEISVPLGSSSIPNREPMLETNEVLIGPQVLRHLTSRKDLQKQQKLVKRVSDLEGKLEAARRQLAQALGEPVPAQAARISRSRFTPGTLASLPSERLLSVCQVSESNFSDADASVEVGMAISIDNRTSPLVPEDKADKQDISELASPTSQRSAILALDNALVGSSLAEGGRHTQKVDLEMAGDGHVEKAVGDAHRGVSDDLTPARQTRKRKSIGVGADDDGEAYRHTLNPGDDYSSEAPQPSIPKREPGRPRKLQKIDPEPKSLRPDPIEAKQPVSKAIMEANSPLSSYARTDNSQTGRRAVLSKKATSSANNSRIPRKGRYSTSPPPPMSSSGIIYTGREVSAGNTAKEYSDGGLAISVVPSADVPPIPEISAISGPRKALRATLRTTRSRAQISTHDSVDRDQKKSQTANTDVKNTKSKSKQAFEWPADVF